MIDALSGATALGAFAIAAFFVRFWRESGDRFHALFAASFVLLGAQRLLLVALEVPNEANPLLYIPRLAAYLLIIAAVILKNLGSDAARG